MALHGIDTKKAPEAALEERKRNLARNARQWNHSKGKTSTTRADRMYGKGK